MDYSGRARRRKKKNEGMSLEELASFKSARSNLDRMTGTDGKKEKKAKRGRGTSVRNSGSTKSTTRTRSNIAARRSSSTPTATASYGGPPKGSMGGRKRYASKPAAASTAGQAQAATRSSALPGGKTPRSASWKADANPTGASQKANYGKAKGFGGNAQSANSSIKGDAKRMTKPRRKPGRRESPTAGMSRIWNGLGGKKKRGNDWYNKAVQRGFGRI